MNLFGVYCIIVHTIHQNESWIPKKSQMQTYIVYFIIDTSIIKSKMLSLSSSTSTIIAIVSCSIKNIENNHLNVPMTIRGLIQLKVKVSHKS